MKPNISLTLGLVAGTNVLVFCQSPREPGLMCLSLHRHVGNASIHPPPVMLGFISFSPTGLYYARPFRMLQETEAQAFLNQANNQTATEQFV